MRVWVGRIEKRQSQEIEVYDGRRQRALSSKARASKERKGERARWWKSARFCSDVDIFVGNSGLYAYAIIIKQRSIVPFVFVFLSAAADLIWIRFKSAQTLYCCCCCFILFLSPKSFSTTNSTSRKHFSGHASGVI